MELLLDTVPEPSGCSATGSLPVPPSSLAPCIHLSFRLPCGPSLFSPSHASQHLAIALSQWPPALLCGRRAPREGGEGEGGALSASSRSDIGAAADVSQAGQSGFELTCQFMA